MQPNVNFLDFAKNDDLDLSLEKTARNAAINRLLNSVCNVPVDYIISVAEVFEQEFPETRSRVM